MYLRAILCIFVYIFYSMVFWLGDLNYRIDMEIGMVKEHIYRGQFSQLLKNDQVLHAAAKHYCIYLTYETKLTYRKFNQFKLYICYYDKEKKSLQIITVNMYQTGVVAVWGNCFTIAQSICCSYRESCLLPLLQE